MQTDSIKRIQHHYRLGSHNIHHHPQQEHGLIFVIAIVVAAFSTLALFS
ncbi:hypothetical protein [Brenneria uluponensis]|nr:hypothetical protein [Brenneria ulupoensis]